MTRLRRETWSYLKTLLAGVSMLLLPSSGETGDKGLARRYLDEGQAYYRRGDLDGALNTLNKAVEEDPSLGGAYAMRAVVRHALGADQLAGEDVRRAQSMQVNDAASFVQRGHARVLAGDPLEALADFDAAHKRDRDNPDAHLGRGRAWRALGQTRKAVAAWSEALRLDPKLVMAYFDRGRALAELGETAQAIDDLARALRTNPKFPLPYALLGRIFAERGDAKRAIQAYSKAIFLHPPYAYAYMGRAMTYLNTGQKELAFRDFAEAVRSAPGLADPYYNRGEAEWRLGDKEAAVSDFKKALAAEVRHPPAALAMGDRLALSGLPEDALAMYTKALVAAGASRSAARPAWVEAALLRRASVLERLRRGEEALRELNEAVRLSSESVAALTARGSLLFKTGQDPKAQADLDLAIFIDPKHAPGRVARGRLLAANGKYQAAMEDFNAAARYAPNLASAHNNRGLLNLHGFSDATKAVADFEQAVALAPKEPELHSNLALALFRQREYRRSLQALDQALRLGAPPVSTLRRRAEVGAAMGDVAGAIRDIRTALESDPKSGELYTTLGAIRLSGFDAAHALRDLGQAEDLDFESPALRMNLASAYGLQGDHRQAVKEFKRACELETRSVDAHAGLCRALRLDGDSRQAVKACNRALELDSKHAKAYRERGLAHYVLKEYEAAAADLYEGYRFGAPLAAAELTRSAAHARLRQWREADSAYRSAMDLDPAAHELGSELGSRLPLEKDYYAHVNAAEKTLSKAADDPYAFLVRGDSFHNAGYFDRAIVEYTKAMEIDGNLPAAYLDRCAALSGQQSLEAAEQDCRRAVELAPGDPQGHFRLLMLLTLRRRYQPGLKAAAEAVRAAPKSAAVYVRAGNLRYFLKDIARAEENYRLALAAEPASSDAHNGIGLCQFAAGRYLDAVESFSRAIALNDRIDRYHRNRAASYVNLRDYANAAQGYRAALAVNTDPEMAPEYQKLISNTLSLAGPPAEAGEGSGGPPKSR